MGIETYRAKARHDSIPLCALSSVDEHRSRLEIKASYRVPLGGLGRTLDRPLLHLVAEATIRSFLQRLAEDLAAPPGGSQCRASGPRWRLFTS